MSDAPKEIKTYRSGYISCRTVLEKGKVINFVSHLYSTSIPAEITELDSWVAVGVDWLSVATADEMAGTVSGLSFMETMKLKYEDELRAQIELERVASLANPSSSELNPVNTAQLTGASDSSAPPPSSALMQAAAAKVAAAQVAKKL